MTDAVTDAPVTEATVSDTMEDLIRGRSVIVCCGPGGVGKTTVSAAIAVAGAMQGRSACVVTIDPARRLADALGLDITPNVAHGVSGPWPGRLAALTLDAAGTFDELVSRYADGTDQAARITSNRLYKNLVGGLSGTQEYMATERLFALHQSGEFDLIVVDTPPSRHAVDFLSAPRRLTGFLDNRLFRLLVTPGAVAARAVSVATQLLLRTISKVAGSEIVEDTIAFFQAFEGMEQGFRERAKAVENLLDAKETAFVLVASPRGDALTESAWIYERIVAEGRLVDALVLNRVLPRFAPSAQELVVPERALTTAWGQLIENANALSRLADAEDQAVASGPSALVSLPRTRIPMLEEDVHDLSALELVARHLVARAVP